MPLALTVLRPSLGHLDRKGIVVNLSLHQAIKKLHRSCSHDDAGAVKHYFHFCAYRRGEALSYILGIHISEFAIVVCEETAALPVPAVDPDLVSVIKPVSGHHAASAAVICLHDQAGSRRQIAHCMGVIIGCVMDVVNRPELSVIAAGNMLQFLRVKFLVFFAHGFSPFSIFGNLS